MNDWHMTARLMARAALPHRNWFPIETWLDTRYDRYFATTRTSASELEAQRIAARGAEGPLFSIVVPLFETPLDYLRAMADSVLGQTYPNFELILVNASPERPELQQAVDGLTARDSRIKPVTLDGNFGITENTNRGIDAASGDFVCFMDHDDWIEPDTLFEYAAAIAGHDDIDVLYCDEDLVEQEGGTWRHRHPLFKPDYSPELLLCKNYVIHLLAVRASVLERIPKPGPEFDGSQDYNLTLMAAEQARRVHHVARVLYHWRMSDKSTASNPFAKLYDKRAWRLAAKNHLARTGAEGRIIGTGIANLYTIWFLPGGGQKVTIVATLAPDGQRAAGDVFAEAFSQVNTHDDVEVVFVCGGGDGRPALDFVENLNVRFVEAPDGAGLLERFNRGAREATGDVLVFLGADCQFIGPEPIEQLVGLLDRPGVGIVAPKVLFVDYTVKAYGVGVSGQGVVPLYRGYALDHPSDQCLTRAFLNTSAVGYQGLTITRALFEALGGFDAAFTGELGAVDLCQRAIGHGEHIATTCNVELQTAEAPPAQPFADAYRAPDYPEAEIELLYDKHPALRTSSDPYRSPHLDLSSSYPILRR